MLEKLLQMIFAIEQFTFSCCLTEVLNFFTDQAPEDDLPLQVWRVRSFGGTGERELLEFKFLLAGRYAALIFYQHVLRSGQPGCLAVNLIPQLREF